MGAVNIFLGVWTADGSAILNVPVKADTGADYCQLPANTLRTLGWETTEAPAAINLPMVRGASFK